MPIDAKEFSKKLTDAGKIIEGGWQGLLLMAYPHIKNERQIEDMRQIFFAGAHHLFASMMTVLDPGGEPTDDDMRRIVSIEKELQEFIQLFELKYLPTKGNS